MLLENYHPRSMLVNPQTKIDRPRFPVIDAHNHLGDEYGDGWIHRPLEELLSVLEQAGVVGYVDLDGGWGEAILDAHLKALEPALDRFRVFGGVDWSAWTEQGDRFGEWAAGRLRLQVQRGAAGLKVWKPFGLQVCDQHGRLVSIDDERLDPLWATAGELQVPVLMHIADPVAFFEPLDETNERWEELNQHPDWQFPSPPFPAFIKLLADFHSLVKHHPETIFIGAHVGNYAENLGWVGQMLDDCPNYFIDISARTSELGRQPYTARNFFLRYAERILFGLDFGPDLESYRVVYRFLESADEYFPYSADDPMQGRWNIYGLYLPDEVLEKVYFRNAARLLDFEILP